MVVSRRAFLGVPLAVACGKKTATGFRGYAFVANEEGQAIAVVDLQALAVAKHIPIEGQPTQVVAAKTRTSVYALAPAAGTLFEIQSDRLSVKRKLNVGPAISMRMDPQERGLYVLTSQALLRVGLDSLKPEQHISFAETPVDFALAPDGKAAAVSFGSSTRFLDTGGLKLGAAIGEGDFGSICFLADAKTMIAADRRARRLSLYDTGNEKLITHLPLAVRPDNLCFNSDGGQLFVTGEGLDAVVIVFPYHTPEVFQTVLAGHAPGAMAASARLLFIASPQSGDVSVLDVATQKVIAVVSVGSDPGCVVITPDDQYALVLNRKSGDMAVLRVGKIEPNWRKSAASLLTVIPVGSRPVSAAVRAV